MTQDTHYFHFTLGPVQGFVAQARRTRDFWAGSFLLSWLAAVAMKSVEVQGGKVIFPSVDEDYLKWLEGKGERDAPAQGCIPNRFKGGLAEVSSDFDPKRVFNAVNQAWQGLAEQVWEADLAHCSDTTRTIWERQNKQFWEISWVLTKDALQSDLLHSRKNWRSHLASTEPGVKCMMMDGLQELSGTPTPNAKVLKIFWDDIRRSGGSIQTDLREGEYLCAIAFIKRRFAHCFEHLDLAMNGWNLKGWKVSAAVPSVAYMAAAHWLAETIKASDDELVYAALSDFHHEASVLTSYDEYDTHLSCIEAANESLGHDVLGWNTKSLDGNVFFEAALDNKNIYPDRQQALRTKRALMKLSRLNNHNDQASTIGQPSPFYAILLMDGDSLGMHMSDQSKQKSISLALNQFTQGVKKIVEQHQSGFLIYAGGDDVLALLPLEYALPCALEIRGFYMECFTPSSSNGITVHIPTTLSGAIQFCHIRTPLTKVLMNAHDLLDNVAKDHCGRDSIAVRVWKPGGQKLQWAMPWVKAIEGNEVVIDKLAMDFAKTDQETPFSSSFFYHLQERFNLLNGVEADNNPLDQEVAIQLMAVEYLNSGVNKNRNKKLTIDDAIEKIKPLIEQCIPKYRYKNEWDEITFDTRNTLNPDAAMLIRFLAEKGAERGHNNG